CTSVSSSPRKHCQMALCSLSTGKRETPACSTACVTICPAMTSVSLFASAIVLPAAIAAKVGLSPTKPEVAATTISASACVASSNNPCSPSTTSGKASCAASSTPGMSAKHATRDGLNSCTCCVSNETLLRAAIATT